MQEYFERAIDNVVRHGDTDVFPFPIENQIFFDCKPSLVDLLRDLHGNFDTWFAKHPPVHEGALTPVSYTGFRWATQLDPLWNLYFLALVLSIADAIEFQRIPAKDQYVFSYRYRWNQEACGIFDTEYNWRSFMEQSLRKAEHHAFVVVSDISEFYPRIGHHRLENALAHLGLKSDIPTRIKRILSQFSGANSFGLPIGGAAARILSELVLNQIDQLLKLDGTSFCRFSDDFHLFANSLEDAYAKLISLSDKLQRTQGLQLQKAKTRVMSSSEFIATSPVRLDDHDAPPAEGSEAELQEHARGLLRFSLRFDPYSPTADEDYEKLKAELQKFDVMTLLQSELSKSRIHVALARKVVAALRYLDPPQRDQAIISVLKNADLLYPIFATVLTAAKHLYPDISAGARVELIDRTLSLLRSESHVLRVELNLAYAVRLLACHNSPTVQETFVALYNNPNRSALVRRDIILAMARWDVWHWLSERRSTFRSMSQAERRAFIIASYTLKDEGKHWRQHVAPELSPFEKLVRDWAASKTVAPGWAIPL